MTIRRKVIALYEAAGRRSAELPGRNRFPMTHDRRAEWRQDIDALAFEPDGHGGPCMVHRLAFRTLIRLDPTSADCLAYFATHEDAFLRAAQAKITRRRLKPGMSLHLTSRDLARALAVAK
jgi:hypothetical protein